jgi:hypothetical protein
MRSSSAFNSSVSRGLRPAAGSSRHNRYRIDAHGAGDLQPPLRAVRQGAGRVVGAIDQSDPIQPVPRLFHPAPFGGAIPPRPSTASSQ